MLPPWVIDQIRREEERRRLPNDDGRRVPLPESPRRAPRTIETEDERDSNRVPVVVDVYGDDTPDPGVGDVIIR